LFRLQGHEVYCAANGPEAVDVVRARPPDVMVLDVAMPTVDGLAVLRTLRESGLLDGLTVVMYTANSDEPTLREAMQLGARDFILKGKGWDELYGRVARYLTPEPEHAA
jgi:two-component system KDP operon response regulator KdpE